MVEEEEPAAVVVGRLRDTYNREINTRLVESHFVRKSSDNVRRQTADTPEETEDRNGIRTGL